MQIHGKIWLPFWEYAQEKWNIKNDAVPHKPNYVKRVLSGDLTFFIHAADYFSYLTNEKCCYKVHFYSLFIWHRRRRRCRCSVCCCYYRIHSHYLLHGIYINYVRIQFWGIDEKITEISDFLLLLVLLLSVLSYCY